MLRFQDFLGAGGPDLRDFDDASAVPGAQRQGACILLRIWLFVSAARVASVQVKHGDPNQQRGYGAVPFCYRPAFHPPVPLTFSPVAIGAGAGRCSAHF